MTISKQDLTLGVIAVLAISITAPSRVAAQDNGWTGLASENWFNELNWSTFSTPGENENALVGAGPNNPVINGQATPALNILNVGVLSGSGMLTVSGGGDLITTRGNLGNANLATLTGTVIVTGGGSTWVSDTIHVGQAELATGNLTVESGGFINVDALIVGNSGTGTFSVLDGGVLQSGSGTPGTAVTIGAAGTSTGTFVVSGEGSVWNSNSNLIVGGSGTGELSILEGGLLESTTVTVGNNTGSSGSISVSGAGSVWNSSAINLGNSGTAVLTVENGGLVDSGAVSLGTVAAGNGSLRVDSGSRFSAESLTVGVAGTGAVTVAGGGVVSVGQPLLLAEAAGSFGTVNIGDGAAAGFIEASAITGGAGSAVLNFNHNEEDYHFTQDGTGEGTLVNITGSTEVRHSGSGTTRLTGNYDYTGGTTVNAGTLRLDGGLIDHAGADITVSSNTEGGANFVIENAGVVNSLSGEIAEGSVSVTGSGSTWTNADTLRVGVSGAGSLSVDAGGQVSSASGSIGESAAGSALVSGEGSSWAIGGNLTVGNIAGGDGALTIAEAGVVSATGLVTLASDGASAGVLNIGAGDAAGLIDAAAVTGGAGNAVVNFNHSDASYLFTRDGTATGDAVVIDGTAVVNHIGSGTTVLSGANTYAGGTTVNAGTLRVDGVGASISHAGAATTVGVMAADDGTLVVENGAVVTNANGVIGRDAGAQGAVRVTGTDSQWVNQGAAVDPDPANGSVVVGLDGNGMLTVAEGGAVRAGSLTLASIADSVGLLNVGAGEAAGLIDAASVTGGDGSAVVNFNHSDASYLFTRDGTATGDAVVIGGSTAVNHIGSGTTVLSGANTYTGGTTVNAGTLRVDGVGASISHALANITVGAVVDDDGTLVIENGAVVTNADAFIGRDAGAQGTVLVTGAGTRWVNEGDPLDEALPDGNLTVGLGGTGALTVADAAEVSVSGTLALASAEGSSGQLNIGAGGAAGLINAAEVVGGAGSAILNFNHAEADYRFSRDGMATGELVGITGSTEVRHSGEGTTRLTGVYDYTGGTTVNAGTLRVDGGSVSHSGANVIVGNLDGAVGNFVVENGASVTAANGLIGQAVGAAGSATVTGAGSLWRSEANLFVGVSGDGELTVLEGGSVSVGGQLGLAILEGTNGALNIGQGAGVGFVDAAGVVGGAGAAELNFFHNDAEHLFTRDGTGEADAVLIMGSTAVNHVGTGTTVLRSTNTYTGNTNVSNGVLRAGAESAFGVNSATSVVAGATLDANNFDQSLGSLAGDGAVTLGTASLTVGGNNLDTTFSGIISGSGSVNKVGTGGLTLAGANTYTGATTVGAGVLRAGVADAFGTNSATMVAAGATLDANNFSQTLGSLAGGGQVLLGTATLTTGGSGADTLFSGVIAGDGAVVKTGAGSMTLTGGNSYLGGTTISEGTLQIGNGGTTGSITGNVANDGVLTFNRADVLAFGGVISGSGELNQNGAGTLILNAESNGFSGPTAVNDGRLLVNGGIAGSVVSVNSGGTLGGTGVVGGIVTNGGAVAPGNSIGTLSVSGNVDFTGGGVYQVEANATASDRIQATGTATLGGGSVSVVRSLGDFATSMDYTILTADGGLSGEFDSVAVDLLLFTASLRQESNNVILNLSFDADTFTGLATTSNQQAVANVLAQLAGNPDFDDIFNNLVATDAAGVRRAFETLNGSEFTNALHLGRVVNRQFESLLFGRMSGSSLLPGGGNAPVASLEGGRLQSLQPAYTSPTGARGGGASADAQAPERGFWARAMGGFGEIDSTRSEPGADFDYTGLALGFDTELPARVLPGTDVIVGGAFGYTTSDAEVGDGDLDADGFHLAAYSRLRRDNGLYLNAIAGYGRNDIDSKRSVVVGSSTSEAKANFDSSHINLALEGGKDFPWQKHSFATPFVGLEYTRFSRDGFTEKGAGVANLTVDDDSQNSLRSVLGGRLSYQFVAGSARTLVTPTVELAYVREFLDDDSRVTAGFAAAPGATFKVEGPSLDRNRLRMGAGLAAQLSGDTSLHFGYQGEFAGSDDHHSFAATFRKTW